MYTYLASTMNDTTHVQHKLNMHVAMYSLFCLAMQANTPHCHCHQQKQNSVSWLSVCYQKPRGNLVRTKCIQITLSNGISRMHYMMTM